MAHMRRSSANGDILLIYTMEIFFNDHEDLMKIEWDVQSTIEQGIWGYNLQKMRINGNIMGYIYITNKHIQYYTIMRII